MRLRLDLGYDGSEFHGWAAQPELRTVQGLLEEALAVALRLPEPPALTVAGRTDAGVHARGQVVHSDVPQTAWTENGERVIHRLTGLLPADMRVMQVAVAPTGFDARFSASSRRYIYRLCDDPVGIDPIRRTDVVWNRHPLDVDAMNEAAAGLLGEHDFASFCRRREGASTVRTLRVFQWKRKGNEIETTVVADAFCHNMVRSIVGACVAVGEGRRSPEWVGNVLREAERSSSVMVMPPHGLTLEEVTYPPDEELAKRAQAARRYRG